jgi:hypothetical protein
LRRARRLRSAPQRTCRKQSNSSGGQLSIGPGARSPGEPPFEWIRRTGRILYRRRMEWWLPISRRWT